MTPRRKGQPNKKGQPQPPDTTHPHRHHTPTHTPQSSQNGCRKRSRSVQVTNFMTHCAHSWLELREGASEVEYSRLNESEKASSGIDDRNELQGARSRCTRARRWKTQGGAFNAPQVKSRFCVHGHKDPTTPCS